MDNKLRMEDLLDELMETIENSPNALMSKKKAIDAELISEIVDDIRKAFPEDMAQVKIVMKERDHILEGARAQAEKIVADAEREAAALIEENTITRAAYEKAAETVERAKQKSHDMRKNANTYADEVLSELETFFTEYINIIKENKKRIYNKAESSNDNQVG